LVRRQTAIEVAKISANKLQTHEAVCAERWKETITRIKRIEAIMIGFSGSTIVMLITMLWRQT
tara:strand:- start:623 stop:811 length:189 start_codon:yes stop_codon:yes gene_type:complete